MQKILVPFDFSTCAEYALDFAHKFASSTKGAIKLLHIIEHSAYGGFNASPEVPGLANYQHEYITELVINSNKKMQEICDSEAFKDIDVTYEVKIGSPFHNIITELTHYEADLIVMGTKGSSGIEEMFIGSNAEKVVRFAKCPVITIPDKTDFNNINDIVYAINFEDEQRQVVELLKSYQKIFDAKLHILWINTLHIIEDAAVVNERLEHFAKSNGIENFETHSIRAITPEQGILNFTQETSVDMIAMATHGFKGLTHLFLGSIAEDIVNHAKTPVWTLSIKALDQVKS